MDGAEIPVTTIPMRIITDFNELASVHGGVLVPTMGAFHAGHLALIRVARETPHRPVIVSIFVNPTQFAPNEDFEQYPRKLEEDCDAAQAAGAEIIFTPSVETMYPPGGKITPPQLPGVAKEPGLEDACRPGHFQGVCQAVARLFDLLQPLCAVFGEKDYQQLKVIQAMVQQEGDRWKGLEILGHETVREPDGLAMSSRNVKLAPGQRDKAQALSQALKAACPASDPAHAEVVMKQILEAQELKIDYAVVRDAETLLPVETFSKPTRAIIAARLGEVRLIDNAPLPARP